MFGWVRNLFGGDNDTVDLVKVEQERLIRQLRKDVNSLGKQVGQLKKQMRDREAQEKRLMDWLDAAPGELPKTWITKNTQTLQDAATWEDGINFNPDCDPLDWHQRPEDEVE